jgi:hypothetical protein
LHPLPWKNAPSAREKSTLSHGKMLPHDGKTLPYSTSVAIRIGKSLSNFHPQIFHRAALVTVRPMFLGVTAERSLKIADRVFPEFRAVTGVVNNVPPIVVNISFGTIGFEHHSAVPVEHFVNSLHIIQSGFVVGVSSVIWQFQLHRMKCSGRRNWASLP